jgi:Flp pilus assembly pilin Flp
MNLQDYPLVTWLRVCLALHTGRLRTAWRSGDRGASAVELAVIAAFLVGIALILLVVIENFVKKEGNQIKAPKAP